MARSKAVEKWIEAGYLIFAVDGADGILVERMSRMLQLNKSGFYHYFGDIESFAAALIKYHYQMFDLFLQDATECKNIDPDYLFVMVKHTTTVMAHVQMVRNKTNPFYHGIHKELDDKVGRTILAIWSRHINILNDPELAFTYHGIVRDMVFARLSQENFTYPNLHIWADEVKEIVSKMIAQKNNTLQTI